MTREEESKFTLAVLRPSLRSLLRSLTGEEAAQVLPLPLRRRQERAAAAPSERRDDDRDEDREDDARPEEVVEDEEEAGELRGVLSRLLVGPDDVHRRLKDVDPTLERDDLEQDEEARPKRVERPHVGVGPHARRKVAPVVRDGDEVLADALHLGTCRRDLSLGQCAKQSVRKKTMRAPWS